MYALPPKYSTLKTSAPPSDAVPTSFGVWISVKPCERRKPRKSWHTPDCARKMAWLAGVRRSRMRWLSRTSWLTRGSSGSAARAASEREASSICSGSSGRARLTQYSFVTCSSTPEAVHEAMGSLGTVSSP